MEKAKKMLLKRCLLMLLCTAMVITSTPMQVLADSVSGESNLTVEDYYEEADHDHEHDHETDESSESETNSDEVSDDEETESGASEEETNEGDHSDSEEKETDAAEGETEAADEETDAAEGETGAADEETDAAEGETGAADEETDAAEGETGAADKETDAAEGETGAADKETDAADSEEAKLYEYLCDQMDELQDEYFGNPAPSAAEIEDALQAMDEEEVQVIFEKVKDLYEQAEALSSESFESYLSTYEAIISCFEDKLQQLEDGELGVDEEALYEQVCEAVEEFLNTYLGELELSEEEIDALAAELKEEERLQEAMEAVNAVYEQAEELSEENQELLMETYPAFAYFYAIVNEEQEINTEQDELYKGIVESMNNFLAEYFPELDLSENAAAEITAEEVTALVEALDAEKQQEVRDTVDAIDAAVEQLDEEHTALFAEEAVVLGYVKDALEVLDEAVLFEELKEVMEAVLVKYLGGYEYTEAEVNAYTTVMSDITLVEVCEIIEGINEARAKLSEEKQAELAESVKVFGYFEAALENRKEALNTKRAEVQEKIDAFILKYLESLELTEEEIFEAVAKMDWETVQEAYQGIGELEESLKNDFLQDREYWTEHASVVTLGYLSTALEYTVNPMVAAASGEFYVTGTDNQVYITWSSGNGTCTESNGSVTATAKGSAFWGTDTTTIIVTNKSDTKATITFDFSASNYDEFNLNSESSPYTTEELEVDGTATISITAKGSLSASTSTLKLSNFIVTPVMDNPEVTFTYDNTLGSITVEGNACENNQKVTVTDKENGVSLVAVPNSGTTFVGWVNAETHVILSAESSYILKPTSDVSVEAAFATNTSTAYFRVGTYLFDDLNAAVTQAESGLDKTIVLAADGTLKANESSYNIPSGITLLIPFDAADTCYTTKPELGHDGAYATPMPYRTLVIDDGVELTIDGTMSVSAKLYAASGGTSGGGKPYQTYGYVKMKKNSAITVNGKLCVYGYISGTGEIYANPTAEIYESFQLEDFRGGSQTSEMKNEVFPFSQYYVQNIEVKMTLESGATEYSYAAIHIDKLKSSHGESVAFIGKDKGMFDLQSGSVSKKYEKGTDRLRIEADGTMKITSLSVKIGPSTIVGGIKIDSNDYVLPVNGNMTIAVNSGDISIGQKMALLPGAEIIIGKEATCTLESGYSIYVYDSEEWGGYASSGDKKILPATYVPEREYTRKESDLVDARIEIQGRVNSSAGWVYTTEHGAEVVGAEGATAHLQGGTETVTYQLIYNNNNSSYANIPITPAKLQNADGSYRETAAGTTVKYGYKNGIWYPQDCVHSFGESEIITPVTCLTDGEEKVTCTICGYTENRPIKAEGRHTPGDEATCTTDQICTVCKEVIEKAKGHTPGTAASCTTNQICTECEEVLEEAKGHTPGTAANCENPQICTICEEVLEKAKGHTPGEPVYGELIKKVTCLENGSHTETTSCTVCKKLLETKMVTDIAKGSHTAPENPTIENQKGATCTSAGLYDQVFYCTECSAEISRETITGQFAPHTEGTAVVEKVKETGELKTATCTTDGIHDEVVYCTICKQEISRKTVTVKAYGHLYGDAQVTTTPATCTENGKKVTVKTCTRIGCGDEDVDTEVIAALGHKEVTDERVAPTCTTDGKTEGRHCERCNTVTLAQETIKALGHTEGKIEDTNVIKPTCTNSGSKTVVTYCSVCKNEISRKGNVEIPALGHTEKDPVQEKVVEATCAAAGSYDEVIYCSVCGSEVSRVPKTIEKLNHTPGEAKDENVTEATCTTDGKHDRVIRCTECNGVISAEKNIVDTKLGHDEEIISGKAATCTETGLESGKKCKRCGDWTLEQKVIPMLPHTEVTVEGKAPTCEEAGLTDGKKCSVCGKTLVFQAEIAPKGHTEVTVEGKAPTCEEAGLTDGEKCSVCGKVLVFQAEIKPAGHKKEVVKGYPATCTETGLTDGEKCSVCDKTLKEQETIKALDHAWDNGKITTDPTCTSEGIKTFTCTRENCGKTTTESVDKKAHTPEVVTGKAPTCEEKGLTDGKRCSVCKTTLEARQEIPAAGHKPGEAVTATTSDATCIKDGSYDSIISCKVCEKELSRESGTIPALGHTEGEPVKENIVPASCEVNGSYESVVSCKVCKKELSREGGVITAPGHKKGPEANCTDAQTCLTCGETIKAALGHDYKAEVETPAKCTTTGITNHTCSRCGDSYPETVPALGHDMYYKTAVEPTCTTDGTSTSGKCFRTGCTYEEEASVIPALGHKWDDGVETKAPTCLEKGVRTYKCKRGSCTAEMTKSIDMLPHTVAVDKAKEATCTETGLTAGSHCSVCNTVIKKQEIVKAKGHTEVTDEAVAATCEETGLSEGKHCSVCNTVIKKQEIVKAKGHTPETDQAVAATCEKTGLTEGSHCSVCKKVLTAQKTTDALGHDWNTGTITAKPTCTADGVKYFECTRCDADKTEKVDALGHTEETDEAVAATCEKTGLTAGKHCSVCNTVLTAQNTVPALGHKWEKVGTVTTEAKCETKGVRTFACEHEGCKKTTTEEIPALGHTPETDEAVKATCTIDGLTEGSHCSVCKKTLTAQTKVPAIGHKWNAGEVTTNPTCTEKGVKTYTCENCKGTRTEDISALGHKEVADAAVAATCETTGLTAGSHCSVCNTPIIKQEVIPAKGHTEVTDAAVAPTCETPGRTEGKHCSVCNKLLVGQLDLRPLGHKKVVDQAVEATCEKTGLTEGSHCFVCNKVLTAQTKVNAKGHTEVTDKAVEATCTETGLTEGSHCSVCNTVIKKQEIVKANGHKEVIDEAVAATCEKTGLTTGKHCSVCNTVLVKQEVVAAKGHVEAVDKATAPTCEVPGRTEGKHCSVCNKLLVGQLDVPPTGHTEVVDKAVAQTCTKTGLTEGKHCSVCDKVLVKQEEVKATGHTETTDKAVDPTCETAGKTEGSHCSVCNTVLVQQTTIPAKGHNRVVDKQVAPTCTKTGLTEGVHCSVCSKVLTAQEEVKATGHTEVTDKAVAPTCIKTGLTEGKHCSVCQTVIEKQEEVKAKGHTEVTDKAVEATCTKTGLTEGKHCSVCETVLVKQEKVKAKGHTEVTDKAVEATCTETGLTEGKHCSVCSEVLVKQEVVEAKGHKETALKAVSATCTEFGLTKGYMCTTCNEITLAQEVVDPLGHDIEKHDAQIPTYASVGWEAYETCKRSDCDYTTYKEIPMLAEPVVEDYETFLADIKTLEEIAEAYVQAHPGNDALKLMIKYIRTGVDRYNSGSWGIMAGYEDKDFAAYVTKVQNEYNASVTDPANLMAVTGLKNIENFVIPNGNEVDFGHMFGTMDITYHNKGSVNHADVSGWGGDLVDLLSVTDRHGVEGTVAEMTDEIRNKYLCNAFAGESDQFSATDMYGDMDGFYIIEELYKQDYEQGRLHEIMESYFTADLDDEARAEYFLEHRLDGVTSRTAIRNAVFSEYSSNKVIATLEGTREFTTTDLTDLRMACCYAFGDYLCKLAGDWVELGTNNYYTVFSTEESELAPGIEQEIRKATTVDGKQMVYYLATADINSEHVRIQANYNNNDASKWQMSRVKDQALAAQASHSDPNSEKYVPNYNVIAAINASGYNMTTGEPSGLLVMEGVEYHAPGNGGFFGIMKDGTAKIGTKAEYLKMKDQVQEAVEIFGGVVLVKDGKMAVKAGSSYYTDRASRTAVGITRTGKVVFMVLDGRQEPWSCGGTAEEIAQIMLEAGCVDAINLDGGGSTTYVAKQEGEDEITLVSRPSDGFERSVADSLIMVSTAPTDNGFDHARLDSETSYVTVNSSITVTASGVSATGSPAELPEGAVWSVSDETLGMITEDGVFTGLGLGDATVNLMLGETVLGSTTIHVVTPDTVYFTRENLDVVFGVATKLPVVALYKKKQVAINTDDLVFTLSKEEAGEMNGFYFTGNEEAGIRNLTVTAALAANPDATGIIDIAMYLAGEASFDFDTAMGGDDLFAWNREVSNATTEDDVTYMVINPEEPMVTSYTFAIDMREIPIPGKLEELTYMLPGADAADASAWNFLLQLAERVSELTEVTPIFKFNPNFDVDISEMSIVNEYFIWNEDQTAFDEETNTLTLNLNWKDQTQAIDPATANPICIVSGVKLTPKSDAQWSDSHRLDVLNSGSVNYDIYLRANALYTFAQKEENQKAYDLYPFVNPNKPSETGGHFKNVCVEFADEYTLVNSLKNGWVFEDNGHAYYKEGEKLTGIQLINGFYYDLGEDGINVGQIKYTGLLQENGRNRYAKNGTLVTGWVTVNEKEYYFDTDGYGYNGKAVMDEVEMNFENGLMTGGYTGFITKSDGHVYHYVNGEKTLGWYYEGEDLYHFNTETGVMTTGTHVCPDAEAAAKAAYYDFAEDGKTLRGYFNPSGYYYWAGQPKINSWVKNGADPDPDAWYATNGHGHYVKDVTKGDDERVRIPIDGVVYIFDNGNGKLLEGCLVNDNGTLYYYWAGEPLNDGWFEVNGDKYYAYDDGHLAVGKVTIDGKNYTFTYAGVLVVEVKIESTPMYRLFNPYTGEHFYTGSMEERENLVRVGWNYEGIAFNAPLKSGQPVYRMFNPYAGDHHYTMSKEEVDNLIAAGWNYEGVAWNSASAGNIPQYRLYNPFAETGIHHYTGSVEERENLVALGWKYEGIGWFGLLK